MVISWESTRKKTWKLLRFGFNFSARPKLLRQVSTMGQHHSYFGATRAIFRGIVIFHTYRLVVAGLMRIIITSSKWKWLLLQVASGLLLFFFIIYGFNPKGRFVNHEVIPTRKCAAEARLGSWIILRPQMVRWVEKNGQICSGDACIYSILFMLANVCIYILLSLFIYCYHYLCIYIYIY